MKRRELMKFVHNFRRGILNGCQSHRMCFAVCAPLQTLLSMAGVETELVEVDFMNAAADEAAVPMNHVYLRLADGTIIDPTADQFSSDVVKFPKVYIGPLPLQYQDWMREPK